MVLISCKSAQHIVKLTTYLIMRHYLRTMCLVLPINISGGMGLFNETDRAIRVLISCHKIITRHLYPFMHFKLAIHVVRINS